MGIVTYNTLVTISSERAFEEQMMAAQVSLAKQREELETTALSLPREIELRGEEDDIKWEQPVVAHVREDPLVEEQNAKLDTPIKQYTLGDLILNKRKMSLIMTRSVRRHLYSTCYMLICCIEMLFNPRP